jgi:hypothetical protein
MRRGVSISGCKTARKSRAGNAGRKNSPTLQINLLPISLALLKTPLRYAVKIIRVNF